MKKHTHTMFVIEFLKENGHPELVDVWNSKAVRENWLKLRMTDPDRPKRLKTSFLLFCDDKRPELKDAYPYDAPTRMMQRLGEAWKSHKLAKDQVYDKYRSMYSKNKFFTLKRKSLVEKYPQLSSAEINVLLEKIWTKKLNTEAIDNHTEPLPPPLTT